MFDGFGEGLVDQVGPNINQKSNKKVLENDLIFDKKCDFGLPTLTVFLTDCLQTPNKQRGLNRNIISNRKNVATL